MIGIQENAYAITATTTTRSAAEPPSPSPTVKKLMIGFLDFGCDLQWLWLRFVVFGIYVLKAFCD